MLVMRIRMSFARISMGVVVLEDRSVFGPRNSSMKTVTPNVNLVTVVITEFYAGIEIHPIGEEKTTFEEGTEIVGYNWIDGTCFDEIFELAQRGIVNGKIAIKTALPCRFTVRAI
jgi:hypothetical protein